MWIAVNFARPPRGVCVGLGTVGQISIMNVTPTPRKVLYIASQAHTQLPLPEPVDRHVFTTVTHGADMHTITLKGRMNDELRIYVFKTV